MRYASDTHVPVAQSRVEIESVLVRYGAEQFMSGWKEGACVVAFRMNERQISFHLPMPLKNDKALMTTPTGRKRKGASALDAYEQECKRRWRALGLVIKAKLEAVSTGITTFEDEFLAHIVLPGGMLVGDMVRDRIAQAYKSGKVTALLPDFSKGDGN